MITKITIENFKGIGEEVVIPIRPLTLFFGANSAGKSTIMHAFLYAREILERHNCDVDVTLMAGEAVDLGGFHEIVHKHEHKRRVRLKFDLDLSNLRIHEMCPVDEFLHSFKRKDGKEEKQDLSDMGLDAMSAWVELTVGYPKETDSFPVVLSYEVGVDKDKLARIEYTRQASFEASGTEKKFEFPVLTDLNLSHPILLWPLGDYIDSHGPVDAFFPQFRKAIERLYFSNDFAETNEQKEYYKNSKGLILHKVTPIEEFDKGSLRGIERQHESKEYEVWVGKNIKSNDLQIHSMMFHESKGWDKQLAEVVVKEQLEFLVEDDSYYTELEGMADVIPIFNKRLRFAAFEESESGAELANVESTRFVQQLLTRTIVSPAMVLLNCLQEFRYLGPIREIPARNHTRPRLDDPARWAKGLAAWDLLMTPDTDELVNGVSEWLSSKEKLSTGYELIAKDTKEIDEDFQQTMLDTEWDVSDSEVANPILDELEKLPVKRTVYLYDIEKNTNLAPHSVGVGISQVIPVITAILKDGAKVVQIEQPGLHLHPTQQAAIGDLLITGLKEGQKQLLVETHSIPLILRILRRMRQTSKGYPNENISVTPKDVIILYVESDKGPMNVFEIAVGKDGELLQPWPDKFFNQDYEERFG